MHDILHPAHPFAPFHPLPIISTPNVDSFDMDPNAVADQFVRHYYTVFDSGKQNLPQLAALYRPQSMLTFETNQCQGPEAILQCLGNMRFERVAHNITSISAQPSGVPNAIIVAVGGQLKIDDDAPIAFNQVWHLLQEGNSFWIHNDIFRFNTQ